tara:strand:- start:1372 stop:2301 length:930 start_codon:yes stop_codon:yes gene_type:complete
MLKKIIIAMLFSLLFVQVDWEELKGSGFADKENTTNVMSSDYNYAFNSISESFINEQIWNSGFRYLVHKQNLEIDLIFKYISFFCIFIFALLVIVEGHNLILLFLINPLIVDFCFSQYRSALALALLFLAYMLSKKRPYLGVLILIPTIFIHSSMVLFLSIYFLISILVKKFRGQEKKLMFYCFLLSIVICLSLGPFRDVILTYLNDRRASGEYYHHSGFLFSLFWIILSGFFLIQRKSFYTNKLLLTGIVLIFIYLINTLVLNIYGSRFLSVGFVLFLLAISKFKVSHLKIIIPLFCLNSLLQWIYWL